MSVNNARQASTNAQTKSALIGQDPLVLTNIFSDDYNLIVWRRTLSFALQQALQQDTADGMDLKLVLQTEPEKAAHTISDKLAGFRCASLISEDIAELAEMYALLLDAKTLGIRLTTLSQAMCPRFHFDRVGCRLVSSYFGKGTEWLEDNAVNRTKLGIRNAAMNDLEAGLYQDASAIGHLNAGDVVLLKGSAWEGNENNGAIHRSPQVNSGEARLLLTIDFID